MNVKAVHGGLEVGGGIACRVLQDRRVCPQTDNWRQRRRARPLRDRRSGPRAPPVAKVTDPTSNVGLAFRRHENIE
ncbi:hypothetical protein K439DRAFT_592762 [Ramaria rubella]|nr:hypothetical protein K439DRAFT_592762 [Ramaria rubella]